MISQPKTYRQFDKLLNTQVKNQMLKVIILQWKKHGYGVSNTCFT